jgi:hypothetical protein
MALAAAMTDAVQIVIGVASLIALIGWLRWVGVAGNDGEMRNQHPTGPPKYRRPSNGQNSEPPTITHNSFLQVLSPDEAARVGITPSDHVLVSPVPRTPKPSPPGPTSSSKRW